MSYYGNAPRIPEAQMSVKAKITYVLAGTALFAMFVGGCSYGWPKYRVWSAQMEGEAEFAQAEQNRKISVLEAEAKLDAAKALAAAEVERARGVAQANEIIGQSLKNNESYLRWLWIENLDKGQNSVIYIPTEAGDRKSTRLNSSHVSESRMPSSA